MYIAELLYKVNIKECKGTNTLSTLGEKLSKTEEEVFRDAYLYKSVIGTLHYATLMEPELVFPVNKLGQFMSNPLVPYWIAWKKNLRYLKSTIDYGLESKASENSNLVGFCDAD